jgi:4-hydroxybenzoate polyprenyltransferase
MQIIDKLYQEKQLFIAWIKLIRFTNIIILAAIFILLHVGVYLPVYTSLNVESPLSAWVFIIFVLSVCSIAAGGNVINDYFDKNIDLINKPQKVVIGKEISSQKAMTGYLVLTIAGIAGGFLTGWLIGAFKIGFFFGFGALVLYSYSETLKRKLLIGNLIIALFGFLSILLLWIMEFFALRNNAGSFVIVYPSFLKINYLMGSYAIFAFLTTLVREIIKDIEDVEGDKVNNCQTLPIKTSLNKARLVVIGLTILTIIILILCQLFCWENNMQVLSVFIAPAIQLQLILLIIRLFKAENKRDYHAASTSMKWIMVAGILGIQLVNIHI